MGAINLKIENEIAILEIDQPDSKVNVLGREVMREFSRALDEVSQKTDLKALLITSKKEGIFIAGADIKEIENITAAKDAEEKAALGKQVFDKLEGLNLASVAVINGVCLGGGLELALACKYRVAGFSDKVKIGLPEVNLGILPGWGGTQRLPRLVGLIRAMGMILGGGVVSAADALKHGLVDKLFPDAILLNSALDFTRGIITGKIKISREKKKKFADAFFEDNPIGRMLVFGRAKKDVLKRTKGFYPAPLKILEVLEKTYNGDFKKGCRIESALFGELAVTQVSKNLIRVFYLNEEFKKYPWVDSKVKPTAVNKCGVIGAGVMGGGIAQLVSFNDIPVRIKDLNYDALKLALKTARGVFNYALKKRKLKLPQVEKKMGLISPTLTYKGFENSDMVVEAVIEDLTVKQKVFKDMDSLVSEKTILASNTSSLPIIKIAKATTRPERVIGLHFFNPVHRMPLVEVIRSEKTSDETVAATVAFARRLGKTVIVVGDVTGFLINRILMSYLNEAAFLLDEGMQIEIIDKIALGFGMPMGPLELVDEIGIDIGFKVGKILEAAYGQRMQSGAILEKVKHKGLVGKRDGAGFYIHEGKEKHPNPDIYTLIESSAKKTVSASDMLKRLIYVMINEAGRCLEERVADRPQVVDIGMIMGTGFPPFRAGLLRYADSIGVENVVADLKRFEKESGHVRFKPCNYLLALAEKKTGFYG